MCPPPPPCEVNGDPPITTMMNVTKHPPPGNTDSMAYGPNYFGGGSLYAYAEQSIWAGLVSIPLLHLWKRCPGAPPPARASGIEPFISTPEWGLSGTVLGESWGKGALRPCGVSCNPRTKTYPGIKTKKVSYLIFGKSCALICCQDSQKMVRKIQIKEMNRQKN